MLVLSSQCWIPAYAGMTAEWRSSLTRSAGIFAAWGIQVAKA
jgi:hypothetical protein